MRPLFLSGFAVALCLSGCLTGDSYPKSYAQAYCSSLFECVDEDQIDLLLGYDDAAECREEIEEDRRASSEFQSWQEGDCGFDSEAAASCQEELTDVINDSDCGSMNWLEWVIDGASTECAEVYCD